MLKVFYSITSPFARKVSILVKVTGIDNVEWVRANPMDSEQLRHINPLGKVPALTHESISLLDSTLICDYLDQLNINNGKTSVYKSATPHFYDIQKQHYQANGIIEAAVAMTMEHRRTDSEQSAFWLGRWEQAITATLQSMDLSHCGEITMPTIAGITLASAVGYLDFRQPQIPWRQINPGVEAWHQQIAKQPWFVETEPGKEVR